MVYKRKHYGGDSSPSENGKTSVVESITGTLKGLFGNNDNKTKKNAVNMETIQNPQDGQKQLPGQFEPIVSQQKQPEQRGQLTQTAGKKHKVRNHKTRSHKTRSHKPRRSHKTGKYGKTKKHSSKSKRRHNGKNRKTNKRKTRNYRR